MAFLAKLADWRRRDQLSGELDEELNFHRAQLERDGGAGHARRRLGNLTRLKEETRDMWSIPWLDQLQQDARYALRGLRRSPGFAATVIVTLALGIGANAAMFGVVDRLMFRPFAYLKDPDTVHRVYLRWHDRGTVRTDNWMEYTRFLDLQKWSSAFSQYAAFADRNDAVGVGDAARERPVAVVNASFFDFFDAPPALGRYFTASEDSLPRGADVVVLGNAFWQSEYGSRNVLGTVLQVGDMHLTIIGVTPRGFAGVAEGEAPAVYLPITTYAGSRRGNQGTTYYRTYNWGWMDFMVRRRPGVTVTQASADLSQAYVRSWNAEAATDHIAPASVAKPEAIAGALKEAAGPDPGLEARTALWVSGVALIVLLIACANVANLFLARALKRQREMAVRLALGVSRGRLLRQMLTESLLLAFIGAIAGVLVAQWGGAGIRGLLISKEGASLAVIADWRTLGIVAGAAVVAGVLTGLAPALITRRELATALKAGTREGTYQRSRLRTGLLVAQGALSVLLLVGAGLFVRSLERVKAMRMGYDADPVLFVERNNRGVNLDDSALVRLNLSLLDAAQRLPGTEHAALNTTLPFWSTSSTSLFITGIDSVRRLGRFTFQQATTDYFRVMGTQILRGRGFTPEDRASAPRVMVVSDGMARRLWPGKDALGQCVRVRADTMPCTTVVGIAENIVERDLTGTDRFNYYMPLEQDHLDFADGLLLKMRGDARAQQEAVRGALQKLMPGASYVTVQSFGDVVDGQRRSWRMGATLFVAFGLLALIVAAIGIYGVIGYNVAQRMHELGVRIALGAQSGDVVKLVLGQGMSFALTGIGVGLILALVVARFVEPLLFHESAKDPAVYAGVGLVLLAVAMLACALPALRATRADPNAALRGDS
ncbi:MAG TPA: ABC transporter permease [Gemmatimonadales bacterium]